jgi:hypothetical protein
LPGPFTCSAKWYLTFSKAVPSPGLLILVSSLKLSSWCRKGFVSANHQTLVLKRCLLTLCLRDNNQQDGKCKNFYRESVWLKPVFCDSLGRNCYRQKLFQNMGRIVDSGPSSHKQAAVTFRYSQ